jgi:hypothetical protein
MENNRQPIAVPDEQYVQFKHFRVAVAGRRYNANAEAMPGDDVLFVREPANPADSNAIAIQNLAGQRIGYVPAVIAKDYADLIDGGFVQMTGSLLHCCDPAFDDDREVKMPTVEIDIFANMTQLEQFSG